MYRLASLAITLALIVSACGIPGRDAEEEPRGDGPLSQLQRFGEAAEGMAEAAENMASQQESGQPPAEPVDFRELQEMLPEEVAGLPRTNREGERSGAMGMTVSQATGTYEGAAGDDGSAPRLTLKVSDLGGVGMAAMFGAAWTMASIDRETETEYERTTEIEGHPGYIKYDNANRSGDFQVLVEGRFLVAAQGYGVSDDQLRTALTSIDIDRLEGMRDHGR